MDLLRFLVRLPLLVLGGIFWLLSFVIGDVSWSAPALGLRAQVFQSDAGSSEEASSKQYPGVETPICYGTFSTIGAMKMQRSSCAIAGMRCSPVAKCWSWRLLYRQGTIPALRNGWIS